MYLSCTIPIHAYTSDNYICHFFYKDVLRELVVREVDKPRGTVALIADLSIRGLW